ncbi:YbaB/EbfC family nucleoid-associated protein [Nocardia australiensis]|uniref:YbaB/EbfC family nucleoid-associated protein n=1 Tax=Nocardia australiensis TaxID=2887191 RepID=UPI001D135ED5|nr:YbaB/EbfC family nucleoid-associated protein [Nocardia australiensis]
MREPHPNVKAAHAMMRELKHRIATVQERADGIVARRPSPSGLVIPEVDAKGRLRDLYLAPGTCDRFDNQELAADIMAAITESTADARRQYHIAMNDPDNLPRPIEETMREWQARTEPNRQVPNFGKAEE